MTEADRIGLLRGVTAALDRTKAALQEGNFAEAVGKLLTAARTVADVLAGVDWGTPTKPANIFLVGAKGDAIVILRAPWGALPNRLHGPAELTKGGALNLAAWLVALADDDPDAPLFHALLRGVWST